MTDHKDPWVICPACSGEGACVNPAIDAGGLSADDFADDPDFAEAYFDGDYDEACRACAGTGKVRQSHIDRLHEAVDDRRLAAMEDGDVEGYLTAGDLRWGG